MRYAIIAGLLSFFIALGIHVFDCQTGTHEQCLMSRGLFWVYWLVSFLVAWGIVASFGAFIKSLTGMAKKRKEPQ